MDVLEQLLSAHEDESNNNINRLVDVLSQNRLKNITMVNENERMEIALYYAVLTQRIISNENQPKISDMQIDYNYLVEDHKAIVK